MTFTVVPEKELGEQPIGELHTEQEMTLVDDVVGATITGAMVVIPAGTVFRFSVPYTPK